MSALDRLENLEQAATPGPWSWDGATLVDDGHDAAIGVSRASAVQSHDAELIAALRNAAPALLQVARAAQAFLDNTPSEARFGRLCKAVDALNEGERP